jgi:hypothetical protein
VQQLAGGFGQGRLDDFVGVAEVGADAVGNDFAQALEVAAKAQAVFLHVFVAQLGQEMVGNTGLGAHHVHVGQSLGRVVSSGWRGHGGWSREGRNSHERN